MKIVKQDGKSYAIIGEKAVLLDENNQVKVKTEEVLHDDGRKDVTVRVPCLKVENKQNKI